MLALHRPFLDGARTATRTLSRAWEQPGWTLARPGCPPAVPGAVHAPRAAPRQGLAPRHRWTLRPRAAPRPGNCGKENRVRRRVCARQAVPGQIHETAPLPATWRATRSPSTPARPRDTPQAARVRSTTGAA